MRVTNGYKSLRQWLVCVSTESNGLPWFLGCLFSISLLYLGGGGFSMLLVIVGPEKQQQQQLAWSPRHKDIGIQTDIKIILEGFKAALSLFSRRRAKKEREEVEEKEKEEVQVALYVSQVWATHLVCCWCDKSSSAWFVAGSYCSYSNEGLVKPANWCCLFE